MRNDESESRPPCRLIIETEPHSGAWNMAVDEALLESTGERDTSTVRVYRWAEPTVSLGHFQKSSTEPSPAELASLPQVARLSGGGAILHDREITYSCVIPPRHPIAANPGELYDLVHGAIIEQLREYGVDCDVRGVDLAEQNGLYLCFGRGDRRDIVLAGHKIVGSAQRRRRGAVLQHGSLLLERSPLAPQFTGARDLAKFDVSEEELMHHVGERIAAALADNVIIGGLDDAEIALSRAATTSATSDDHP